MSEITVIIARVMIIIIIIIKELMETTRTLPCSNKWTVRWVGKICVGDGLDGQLELIQLPSEEHAALIRHRFDS